MQLGKGTFQEAVKRPPVWGGPQQRHDSREMLVQLD